MSDALSQDRQACGTVQPKSALPDGSELNAVETPRDREAIGLLDPRLDVPLDHNVEAKASRRQANPLLQPTLLLPDGPLSPRGGRKAIVSVKSIYEVPTATLSEGGHILGAHHSMAASLGILNPCHLSLENHAQDARTDDGRGQVLVANQDKDASPVITNIVALWRMRQRWHRAEKSLTLQGLAVCRAFAAGDKDAARKSWDAALDGTLDNVMLSMALAPFIAAQQRFEAERKPLEKQLRKLARELPVWPFVASVKGFGDLNLAGIIGEAGRPLCDYRSVSAFWKRMGLAVINGERQRRVANVELAIEHGYNPSRRSVAWNLGECLVKAGDGCVYRPVFNERKAYRLEQGWKAGHANRDASRFITKRALRDLWRAWRDAEVSA